MSSIKRSRTFATDAQSVRFLYLILKQLDLKSVNWQAVADGLGIKNGHAARMRWSRFKQHAEGDSNEISDRTHSKKANYDKGKGSKRMREEDRQDLMMEDDFMSSKRVKYEYGYGPQSGFLPPSYGFHSNLANPTPFLPPQPQFVKPEPTFQQDMNSFGDGLLPPTLQTWRGPSASMRPSVVPFRNSSLIPGLESAWEDPDDRPIKQCRSSAVSTVSPPHVHLNPQREVQPVKFYQPLNTQRNALARDTPKLPSSTAGTPAVPQTQTMPSSMASQDQRTSKVTPNSSNSISVIGPEDSSASSATVNASNLTAANASPNCAAGNSAEPVKVKQEPEVIELSSPMIKVESDRNALNTLDDHTAHETQEASDLPQLGSDSVSGLIEAEPKTASEENHNIRDQLQLPEVNSSATNNTGAPATEISHPASVQTTLLDFFTAKPTGRLSTSMPAPDTTRHSDIALNSTQQPQATSVTNDLFNPEDSSAEQPTFEFHNLFPTSFQPFFSPADELECEFDLEEMIRDLPCEAQEGQVEVEAEKDASAASQMVSAELDDETDDVIVVV